MAGAISKGTVASHAKYVRNENDHLDHVYSWTERFLVCLSLFHSNDSFQFSMCFLRKKYWRFKNQEIGATVFLHILIFFFKRESSWLNCTFSFGFLKLHFRAGFFFLLIAKWVIEIGFIVYSNFFLGTFVWHCEKFDFYLMSRSVDAVPSSSADCSTTLNKTQRIFLQQCCPARGAIFFWLIKQNFASDYGHTMLYRSIIFQKLFTLSFAYQCS